ncbi:MAG: efflux RND transporter periplasmic adaptor subunit [Desulfobacteraceae bacterium]|nr:MAG: efflux RND transporter periplasmic adaptor subunit [Desulfobacteraceae bacterium]
MIPIKKRLSRKRSLLPEITSLCLLFLWPAGCEQKQNKYVPPPPPEVTVGRPQQKPVTDYLLVTGNTQAAETADLRARVEGFLASVHFNDGDVVKRGDLLFVIEPKPYEAKVRLAAANVASAEAKLLRANQEHERQLTLIREKATAQSEVERWKAERDAARAYLDETKANAELADLNLSYTRVLAPFDGRIDRRMKDPGNLVGAGEKTLLATISRTNPIYAYFTLSERDLFRVNGRKEGRKPGLTYRAPIFLGTEGEDGYPIEGQLDFSATSLDPGTGTLLIRAIFDNPVSGTVPRLLPGMFVRMRIPIRSRENAVVLPERALATDQSGRYVLVVNDQNVVEQRPVKVGDLAEGLRVIEQGLKGDEWVVLSGIQRARPGSKVTPVKP